MPNAERVGSRALARPGWSWPASVRASVPALVAVIGLVVAGGAWLAACLCAWIGTGRWPNMGAGGGVVFVVRLAANPGRPGLAWRRSTREQWAPGAGPFYAVAATCGLLAGLSGALLWPRLDRLRATSIALGRLRDGPMGPTAAPGSAKLARPRRPGRPVRAGPFGRTGGAGRQGRWLPERSGRWATPGDLRPLALRRSSPGRVVLGRQGRSLLAAEPGHSVLVVGPTQTFKTSGLVVPALIEWEGPVLAASVKADLVRTTAGWRSDHGRLWIFDPTGATGGPSHRWSPLGEAAHWAGAQRMAAWLCESGRTALEDGDFWYATAQKLLAPLLLAASVGRRTMADVVRWVDEQEVAEVAGLLDEAGEEDALRAAEASWRREPRQRGSVYTTAEMVLAPFADPSVAAATATCDVSPEGLLDGGWHSLFLCAPSHEQDRLRPVFTALVQQVIRRAFTIAAAGATPLSPPLLVVVDEAAHIAPLGDLDRVAATAAAHGIQLITVWQDLAQVTARYGPRAATVVNNHRARVILSGVADGPTLEQVSRLVGDADVGASSITTAADGTRSTTASTETRPLLPPGALRRLPPGEAVLLYGHLPPARMTLRPWFRDPTLSRRVRPLAGPLG